MKPSEATRVLSAAATFDRRTVGRADAEAWADALGDIKLDDAVAAVRHHYATSREFIYPSDVTSIVKAVRAERIRAAGDISNRIPLEIEAIEDQAEHTRRCLEWLQNAKRRIGDGESLDEVAPRIQLVPGDPKAIEAITERLARDKRAPEARERGETA